MATATKTHARTWNTGPLRAEAAEYDAARAALMENVNSSVRDVRNAVGVTWRGLAAGEMSGHVDGLETDARKVDGALEQSAIVRRNGADAIDTAKAAAVQLIDQAERERFAVAEDGSVIAPPVDPATLPEGATVADLLAAQAALDAKAKQHEAAIKPALQAVGDAAANVDSAIRAAVADLAVGGGNGVHVGAGGSADLSGQDGEELGKKVSEYVDKGEPIPPELANEVATKLQQANLSPDQVAALGRGEDVAVSPASMDFSRSFAGAAGGDGLGALRDQYLAQGGAQGQGNAQAVSNSVAMLGAPKVSAGATRGGYQNLPPELQRTISSRVNWPGEAPDGNTTEVPVKPQLGPGNVAPADANSMREHEQDLSGLGSVLGGADKNLQPDTFMATELDRQAGHMAWMEDNAGLPDVGRDKTDAVVDGLAGYGSRNVEASHLMLTGGEDSDPTKLGAGYNRDDTMVPLLVHGGEGTQGLVDWVGRDATASDVPTSQRAGEAAYGLSQILAAESSGYHGNNYDALMNIDGNGGEAIGQRNPGMTQAISNALSPYIPDMAGVPNSNLTTHGFGVLDNDSVSRVFSVVDTDPEAAKQFNANAYASIAELESRYTNSWLDDPANPDVQLGNAAGRIQAYVEQGYSMEASDRGDDATIQTENKQQAFDRAKEVVDTGLSFVPGPWDKALEYASPARDLLENQLQDSIVGNPETIAPRDGVASNQTNAIQCYNLVQALQSQGHLDSFAGLEPYLGEDGKLVPYDQALGVGNPDGDLRTGSDLTGAAARNYLEAQGFPVGRFIDEIGAGRSEVMRTQ